MEIYKSQTWIRKFMFDLWGDVHCIPAEDLLPHRMHIWSWHWEKAYSTLHLKKLIFIFLFVLYYALFHLPPLRFHCADGCWDRTQHRCNLCIGSQTL